MHPMDIIALLYKSGTNGIKIAEKTGVRASTVSRVIHNKTKSRNVATYISGTLNKPLSELWPGTYDEKQYKHKVRAA